MMNKSLIEWCDFTWNPVTGCQHGCPYCYASKDTGVPWSGRLYRPEDFASGDAVNQALSDRKSTRLNSSHRT